MEIKTRQKLRRKLLVPLFIGAAVPLVGVIIATLIYALLAPPAFSPSGTSRIEDKPPVPVSVTSNSLFFGNAFWGRYIDDWSKASDQGVAYPFSRLNEFNRDDYDAWFAGLECPTVPGDTMSSREMDETLSFNCSPDYLPEAKKWFTGFTLANNHTDNRGAEGFDETKRQLEANGIQYFGHYDPYATDDICEVIALPVTVKYDDDSTKKSALPVAMCGYHMVFKLAPEEAMQVMAQYKDLMPVIAFPHMGVEYQAQPDVLKTTTYRSLINNGADFVLGDHPHWIQTTESYSGKLIVYSMGNFMFDQQDTSEVVRSAGINAKFSVVGANSDTLKRWLEIGEQCDTFKDQCLQAAQDEGLQKLPFTYEFGVVGTDDSGKLVKPANEQQQAQILERLRWAQTMQQLQSPQSGR